LKKRANSSPREQAVERSYLHFEHAERFFTTTAFTVYTIRSVKINNNNRYIFSADVTVVSFLLRPTRGVH